MDARDTATEETLPEPSQARTPHAGADPGSGGVVPLIAKPAPAVTLQGLRAFYGESEQIHGVDLDFPSNQVTAIIGPSGCGKSTMVRCINRLHEEIPGARAEGRVLIDDLDLYGPGVDVIAVRRAVGMVFQKPNPFPTMSIFENVAAGLRLTGVRGRNLHHEVESALHAA
ncbi:MAG TPA: ATP-binding cassette domain-containing protein, partial [Solirubrobacteraceae bacterium]|nr:ATP-binding cassette domain-containing protein [Solirubrobacteraceae bacterium]